MKKRPDTFISTISIIYNGNSCNIGKNQLGFVYCGLRRPFFMSGGNFMPSKTPRQRRAMAAAAAGKSTLGIPKKVGREYARKDKAKSKKRRY